MNAAVEKLQFLVRGEVPNLAQGVLRFVLSHPAVSTAIAGVRTVKHRSMTTLLSAEASPGRGRGEIAETLRERFPHPRIPLVAPFSSGACQLGRRNSDSPMLRAKQ